MESDAQRKKNTQKFMHSTAWWSPRGQITNAVKAQQNQPTQYMSQKGMQLYNRRNQAKPEIYHGDRPVAQTGMGKIQLPKKPRSEVENVFGYYGLANHETEHAMHQNPRMENREIAPSVGDIVFAGEQFKAENDKPLEHRVQMRNGSQDINWMMQQAMQHGYWDGKSMETLLDTPEGQAWLKRWNSAGGWPTGRAFNRPEYLNDFSGGLADLDMTVESGGPSEVQVARNERTPGALPEMPVAQNVFAGEPIHEAMVMSKAEEPNNTPFGTRSPIPRAEVGPGGPVNIDIAYASDQAKAGLEEPRLLRARAPGTTPDGPSLLTLEKNDTGTMGDRAAYSQGGLEEQQPTTIPKSENNMAVPYYLAAKTRDTQQRKNKQYAQDTQAAVGRVNDIPMPLPQNMYTPEMVANQQAAQQAGVARNNPQTLPTVGMPSNVGMTANTNARADAMAAKNKSAEDLLAGGAPKYRPSGVYSPYEGKDVGYLTQNTADMQNKRAEFDANKLAQFRDSEQKAAAATEAMGARESNAIYDPGTIKKKMSQLGAEYAAYKRGGGEWNYDRWMQQKSGRGELDDDMIAQHRQMYGTDLSLTSNFGSGEGDMDSAQANARAQAAERRQGRADQKAAARDMITARAQREGDIRSMYVNAVQRGANPAQAQAYATAMVDARQNAATERAAEEARAAQDQAGRMALVGAEQEGNMAVAESRNAAEMARLEKQLHDNSASRDANKEIVDAEIKAKMEELRFQAEEQKREADLLRAENLRSVLAAIENGPGTLAQKEDARRSAMQQFGPRDPGTPQTPPAAAGGQSATQPQQTPLTGVDGQKPWWESQGQPPSPGMPPYASPSTPQPPTDGSTPSTPPPKDSTKRLEEMRKGGELKMDGSIGDARAITEAMQDRPPEEVRAALQSNGVNIADINPASEWQKIQEEADAYARQAYENAGVTRMQDGQTPQDRYMMYRNEFMKKWQPYVQFLGTLSDAVKEDQMKVPYVFRENANERRAKEYPGVETLQQGTGDIMRDLGYLFGY